MSVQENIDLAFAEVGLQMKADRARLTDLEERMPHGDGVTVEQDPTDQALSVKKSSLTLAHLANISAKALLGNMGSASAPVSEIDITDLGSEIYLYFQSKLTNPPTDAVESVTLSSDKKQIIFTHSSGATSYVDVDEFTIDLGLFLHEDLNGRDRPNQHPAEAINDVPRSRTVQAALNDIMAQLENINISIAMLEGASVGSIRPTNEALPEIAVQNDLNQAWINSGGPMPLVNGNTLVSFNSGTMNYTWTYFASVGSWKFRGANFLNQGPPGPPGDGGVPGGEVNDVLVKNSSINFDAGWRKIVKANLDQALQDELDGKVDKDQGISNTGLVLGVNSAGMVVPTIGSQSWVQH